MKFWVIRFAAIILLLGCGCEFGSREEPSSVDSVDSADSVDGSSQKFTIDYDGGPLYNCPANMEICTTTQRPGNECETGDLLLVYCQVEMCGDCCSTQFLLPIPCCNGYWLQYSNYHKDSAGAITSLPLCPNNSLTLTDSCIGDMCTCDTTPTEKGWVFQDGTFKSPNSCEILSSELTNKTFYIAYTQGESSSGLEYSGPYKCIDKTVSPVSSIISKMADFSYENTLRQSVRECLFRKSDAIEPQDVKFFPESTIGNVSVDDVK